MQGLEKTVEFERGWATAPKSVLQWVPVSEFITQGDDEFQRERDQIQGSAIYLRLQYSHDDDENPATLRFAFLRLKGNNTATTLTYADVQRYLFMSPSLKEPVDFGSNAPAGADNNMKRFHWPFNWQKWEVLYEDRRVLAPCNALQTGTFQLSKHGSGSDSFGMIDVEVEYDGIHQYSGTAATSDQQPVVVVWWIDRWGDDAADETGLDNTANWYYHSQVGMKFHDLV